MSPHDVVAAVCQSLRARAAGYWRADGARLVQVAFVPGEGLDPDVAREFAEATQSVPLSETGLGIVAAATSGEVAVSRAEELPSSSGSGRWLRAFGAARSVAVPLCDDHGDVSGVLSVALPEDLAADDRTVVDEMRQIASVCQAWR